jgi:rhamnulose-1-phosphate aldolase
MGRDTKVVLHTHPTEIIALTHIKRWLDSEALTQMLWSMIPECRMVVTKGVGVVPYISPGTVELAEATVVELEKHDVIVWEKHGVLAVGDDITTCFDIIDTLNKSAQIYIHAKAAGLQD